MLNMKAILISAALSGFSLSGNCQYTSSIRVEQVMKTDTTSLGQKINYPSFKDDEVTILKLTFPPGQSTGWHKHGFPVFAWVMQGNLTVEFENGKTLQFPENSSFSEAIGTYHNGSNRENADLVLLAVYLGKKGEKLSVPMEPEQLPDLNDTRPKSRKHDSPQTGLVTDIGGHTYSTVVIGPYEWMASNLRTTRYNDGRIIPEISSDKAWVTNPGEAFCRYDNDTAHIAIYGLLYNWYAVNTGKLCPAGWRVPGDEEWKYLEGVADSLSRPGDKGWDKQGMRGFDAARRLKARSGWFSGGNGSDSLGLGFLPSGERSGKDGRFHLLGHNGYWWTATPENDSTSWYRSMIYSFDEVSRDLHPKTCGFAVRCIRDHNNIKPTIRN
jgi:uncharacterized protein (TIGR02145 family)